MQIILHGEGSQPLICMMADRVSSKGGMGILNFPLNDEFATVFSSHESIMTILYPLVEINS
jgi:hypothetical protein